MTEAKCQERDEFAQEDHTYKLAKAELDRYRSNWCLQLEDARDNGPMTLRALLCSSRIEKSLVPEFGRLSEANFHHSIKTEDEKDTNSQKYRQGSRIDWKIRWKTWTQSSSMRSTDQILKFFNLMLLLQLGFRSQSMRTTATDVWCRQYTLHT